MANCMIDLSDVSSSATNSVQLNVCHTSAIHISAVCGIKRSVEYPDIRGCLRISVKEWMCHASAMLLCVENNFEFGFKFSSSEG